MPTNPYNYLEYLAISINGQPNAAASAKNVEGASHIGENGVLNNKGTKRPIAEYQEALRLPVIDYTK